MSNAALVDPRSLSRKDGRFSFATEHPIGWFVVAFSEEVPAGEVVRMRYFGRDLIAYRGASGAPYVADAYCPHLGAHLGHGGAIEGETIRCPFHRWRFEGDGGRCVEIPYTDKVPPRAKLGTLPVRELNGTIYAFHDPSGGPPWELPELAEEGWTARRTVHWRDLRTHPQEVFENTVDTAHIGPIHAGRGAAIVGKPQFDRERMEIDIQFEAPGDIVGMPDVMNDVHLHVSLRGLGWVAVDTHVRNVGVRARQRIHVTPVDHETVDIRAVVQVRPTDDPAFTEELARIFYDAYVEDFAKDFPIWENKRYLGRPLLAKGDGPIGAYRKWCTQFYGAEDRAPRDAAAPTSSVPAWLTPLRERVVEMMGRARQLRSRPRSGTDDGPVPRASGAPASAPPASAPPAGGGPRPAPAATTRVASAEEYLETLEQRFVPAAAKGVDAVFQWDLGELVFHARVRGPEIEVVRGRHAAPTVALVIAADDYVKVVNGELDGMRVFASGRGRVEGSLSAAMSMRSLFPT